MRLALLMLAALTLASCSAATGNTPAVAEADQTALEIQTLRKVGICFDERRVSDLTVRAVIDFWIISFGEGEELRGVTAAVSWNPDIPNDLDTDAAREKAKSDTVVPAGNDELLAIPKNYETPYIHFFGGTAEGRRAATKLVTFCKP